MKLIFILLFSIPIITCSSQPRFNRIYRFDSIQGNGTVFRSMRFSNNSIYLAGTNVVSLTNKVANSGIFVHCDMEGNVITNTFYYDRNSGRNFDFQDDNLLIENSSTFLLAAYNFEGSFALIRLDSGGTNLQTKTYTTNDSTLYFVPSSIAKLKNGYAVTQTLDTRVITKSLIFFTDSLLNHTKTFEIQDGERVNISTKIIKNKNNNLTLSLYKTSYSDTDTNYVYISQLREIDTLGNTLWVYNTPRDRFIYVKKFVQLANGNYLVWGDEELSKNVFGGTYWYRGVYAVGPYMAEINPQRGLIWEKFFKLSNRTSGRMYGFKMLKDSSILLTGGYDDAPNSTSAFLIKLNSRKDSIFRRDFRPSRVPSGGVIPYPNQIEELNNGDLLIGGYVWDLPVQSPTTGQWGWLVRTDSMGCSLESSSCRTPTHDIGNAPLSINAYPNPTSGSLTIDFDIQTTFKEAYISLTDILGREVLHQKIANPKGQLVCQTEQLIIGFYIISIVVDNHIIEHLKVSIQK